MDEIIVSTYRHSHSHVSVPPLRIQYLEKDTGNYWVINASIDLAYLIRIGDLTKLRNLEEEQGIDADVMMKRLECALLISNVGFFNFEFVSSVLFKDVAVVGETTTVVCAFGQREEEDVSVALDWFSAFSEWHWLRRAVEDAHNALTMRSEEMFFTFRAFEWLQKGLNISWKNLGRALNIPQPELNRLKKSANNWSSGSRHAVETGNKIRFGNDAFPSWVHGLFHGVVQARAIVDSKYNLVIQKTGNPYPI